MSPYVSLLYEPMLECAHGQSAAAEVDDWETYERLSAERFHLLEASGQAVAEGTVADLQTATDLIRAIQSADQHTAQLLETKRSEIRLELARFRQAAAARAAYGAPQLNRSGGLLDADAGL